MDNVKARVGDWSAELGPVHIVNALGATISYRLEPETDARRFPAVLNGLFNGRLEAGAAASAATELETISRELAQLPPERAVWSVQDLRRRDDSAEPVNHSARHLGEYFIAADGRPLLEVLLEAARLSQAQGQALVVDTWARRGGWKAGAAMLALGIAWTFVFYRFFPDLRGSMDHDPDSTSGVPLWAFGPLIAVPGLWSLAITADPRLDRIRAKYPWLFLALTLVGAWAFLMLVWD